MSGGGPAWEQRDNARGVGKAGDSRPPCRFPQGAGPRGFGQRGGGRERRISPPCDLMVQPCVSSAAGPGAQPSPVTPAGVGTLRLRGWPGGHRR